MELSFVFPPGFRPPVAQGPPWQQQVLNKGWGYATLIPTSVQPDNGAGLTLGIIGLTNKGQPRGLDDWGALRHSRYGKAVLVAMAYDSRFAIAYVSSVGRGRR